MSKILQHKLKDATLVTALNDHLFNSILEVRKLSHVLNQEGLDELNRPVLQILIRLNKMKLVVQTGGDFDKAEKLLKENRANENNK